MKNVKKIIFFLALFLTFINHSHALTPTVEYIDGVYSNRIGDTKTYSGQLGYIWIDGKAIYCLDPYHIIGKEYIVDNNYFNNFSKEDLDYMNLVSEHVSFFVENKNPYYYMAAQELIWERIIGEGKVFWTTEQNGNGDIIDISSIKDEIKNYINNFYTKPSFEGTVVKDSFYSTVILKDTNNVLHNYEVVADNQNYAYINNDELYINVLSSNLNKIKLVRKLNTQDDSKYYHSDINQDIAYLNSNVQVEAELYVQANNKYNAILNLNILDDTSKLLVTGGVKFKILNLETNQYIGEYITYNGVFSSGEHLEKGKYRIELIDVPKNYVIKDSLDFEINEKDIGFGIYQVNYYISKAIARININSFKENKTTYELYSAQNIYDNYNNIIFKKNQLINSIDLLNNESFTTDILPFGKYYILDKAENKKYEIDLEYIDPFTQEVIYKLDIFDSKEDNIIPDNNEDKPSIDDKEDNTEDKDNKPITDDKKDNIDDKPIVDDKEDNIEEKPIEDDKVLTEDNNNNSIIQEDKKPIIDDKEDIPSIENKDNDKTNLENASVQSNQEEINILPNTFDYISYIKLILSLWIIIALFFKIKNHEK